MNDDRPPNLTDFVLSAVAVAVSAVALAVQIYVAVQTGAL